MFTVEDLLAVIHRDGGHHTAEVGLEQSLRDAADKWHLMERQKNQMRDFVEAFASRAQELNSLLLDDDWQV